MEIHTKYFLKLFLNCTIIRYQFNVFFGRWEYWLLFSRHKYPWHLIQQEREAMFHMGLDLLLVFTNADNLLASAVDQNCLLQCVPSAGIHYYNTHHVFFPPSSIVMLLTRTLKLNRFFTFEFWLTSLKCFFPKVHVTTHKMKNNFDRNFQAQFFMLIIFMLIHWCKISFF